MYRREREKMRRKKDKANARRLHLGIQEYNRNLIQRLVMQGYFAPVNLRSIELSVPTV